MFRRLVIPLCAGWVGLAALTATAQPPPPPAPYLPQPAPMIPAPPEYVYPTPPGYVAAPPAAVPTEEAPAEAPAEGEEEAPPTQFQTGDKQDQITPGSSHDGYTEGGEIAVDSPEPNQLNVLMTGTVAAHCFMGTHSAALQSFQLVQEFAITSEDPSITEVILTVTSALNGTLYARHKASGCIQVANASIFPAGCGTPIWCTAHPSSCATKLGGCCSAPHAVLYQHEAPEFTSPLLPPGPYVLVANFVIEATADGFLNGHGVADFTPESPLEDTWALSEDPFENAERDPFGFAVNLTVAPPETAKAPGGSQKLARSTTSRVRVRPLARQVRRLVPPFQAPAPAIPVMATRPLTR